jgi:hypothetical protein
MWKILKISNMVVDVTRYSYRVPALTLLLQPSGSKYLFEGFVICAIGHWATGFRAAIFFILQQELGL